MRPVFIILFYFKELFGDEFHFAKMRNTEKLNFQIRICHGSCVFSTTFWMNELLKVVDLVRCLLGKPVYFLV